MMFACQPRYLLFYFKACLLNHRDVSEAMFHVTLWFFFRDIIIVIPQLVSASVFHNFGIYGSRPNWLKSSLAVVNQHHLLLFGMEKRDLTFRAYRCVCLSRFSPRCWQGHNNQTNFRKLSTLLWLCWYTQPKKKNKKKYMIETRVQ